MQEIILERDIDEDRFISPEHYIQLIKLLPPLSKHQFYFMMLAETGWRPHEVCRSQLDHFNFDDPLNPKIRWMIGKPTRYIRDNSIVKAYKIKWRLITHNFAKIAKEYLMHHAFEIGGANGFIFPSRITCKGDEHIDVSSMQTTLQRIRKRFCSIYPWMNEPYKIIHYPDGRTQQYLKLSLYAFRKLHATQYARELLNRGYTDILLATAQHMGHTNPRTTMRYVKQLIDERPIVNSAFKKIESIVGWNGPKLDKTQTFLNAFMDKKPQ